MAIIYDDSDSDIWLCHSKYIESCDYFNIAMYVIHDISNKKYKNIKMLPIKNKLVGEAYNEIIEKYGRLKTTYIFNNSQHRISADFIYVTRDEFMELTKKYST